MSDLSHLTPEQVDLFLTAVSTTAKIEDIAKAAGDLLAKAIPADVRPLLKAIYLEATQIQRLEQMEQAA